MDDQTKSKCSALGRMCLTISFILESAEEAGTITPDQRHHLWVEVWNLDGQLSSSAQEDA